jgi:hypothetical protein
MIHMYDTYVSYIHVASTHTHTHLHVYICTHTEHTLLLSQEAFKGNSVCHYFNIYIYIYIHI